MMFEPKWAVEVFHLWPVAIIFWIGSPFKKAFCVVLCGDADGEAGWVLMSKSLRRLVMMLCALDMMLDLADCVLNLLGGAGW